MQRDAAEALIQILRQCVPGFTPESFSYYCDRVQEHWTIDHDLPGNEQLPSEVEVGYEVIDQICQSWRHGYRPPWAELMENWRSVLRRLRAMVPVSESGEWVAAKEGRQIAAAAYVDECRQQHREPNWEMFDKIVGRIGAPEERNP